MTSIAAAGVTVHGPDEAGVLTAEALVVEDVTNVAALTEAHQAGRPVVARADSAEAVQRALARPEICSVIVPADRPELLELDLRRLTYG